MEKKQVKDEKLRLIVFKSALELGKEVDKYLLDKYGLDKEEYSFIIPIKEIFFEDGHLKVEINETVRGKDVYFLTDVENHSIEYNLRGYKNHTSPNDLAQQLRDGIGACNSHADKLNVIMPILYAGRQHRKNTRENLACGQFLHELDMNQSVKSIITFDAHDQGVEHALHNTEFDNFFATNTILDKLINDLDKEALRRMVFVAPDNGATGRRNVVLNSFNCRLVDRIAGSFVKVRDYNIFLNGMNPIISHDYCGTDDLEGRTAIVVDDMISSGNSMFDVINELKKRGVKYIYLMTTFALFTRGVDEFEKYFLDKKFDGIYTTNLTYIDEQYKKEWLHICDCSKQISDIIYNIHNDLSISEILSNRTEPIKLLEKKFRGYNV